MIKIVEDSGCKKTPFAENKKQVIVTSPFMISASTKKGMGSDGKMISEKSGFKTKNKNSKTGSPVKQEGYIMKEN